MHQILQAGGTYDESFESIEKWLTFLTDPQDLRSGLPALTVYFGDARFCSITVTFSSTYASLHSLKLELAYVDDEYAASIFKGNWVSNIFLHPELEELDMAFMITELPDLFHKLPKLKVARLTDSKLTKLPASFYQLPALEKLSIDGTSIRELPSELGNLHTLRYLGFSQTWGPAVFGKLKGLEEICSYGSTVPESFLDFPQLRKLHFSVGRNAMNFRFTRVELPCLKELTTNNIAAFGSTLGRFTALEKLQVSGKLNEPTLTSLTASLNQLNKLKFLALEGTGITSIDWCASMLDLEYLNLGHNAIKTIPDNLDKLQKLKTIVLRNNPIATIPGLKPMPQVTFIDLEDTKIPIDENASTNIQPVRNELVKLKQAFPNVEYLSMMEVTVQSSTGQ